MKISPSYCIKWFLLLPLLAAQGMHAQTPGDLSSDFGSGGRLLFDVNHLDYCSKVLATSDRVYLAGHSTSASALISHDYFVATFDHQGNLDPSFGQDGLAIGEFPGYSLSRIIDAELWGDHIYIGGTGSFGSADTQALVVARLTLEGDLDTSFADSGFFIGYFLGPQNDLGGIHVLDDGQILVYGTAFDSNYVHKELPLFGRLNNDGTPDSAFSSSGFVTWDEATGFHDTKVYKGKAGRHEASGGLLDVAVLDTDHYLLCGYYFGSYHLGLNIEVDLSNQANPFKTTYYPILSNYSGYYSSAIEHNGKAVVCATPVNNFSAEDFLIQTIGSDGYVDTTTTLDFDVHQDQARQMITDPQGRIVTVGYSRHITHNQSGYDSDFFSIAVMEDVGQPDPSFSEDGQVSYDFGLGDECGAVSVAAVEDYLFVVGYVKNTADSNDLDIGILKIHNAERPLSVEQKPAERGIAVFPNPSSGLIHIQSDMYLNRVDLMDIHGHQLHSWVVDGQSAVVDVSSQQSGCYLLRLTACGESRYYRIIRQ